MKRVSIKGEKAVIKAGGNAFIDLWFRFCDLGIPPGGDGIWFGETGKYFTCDLTCDDEQLTMLFLSGWSLYEKQ